MAKTEVTGAQIKDQSVSLTADVTGVLPVANGGSGASTIALNNVVLGNGNSAVQTVAPGTAGYVLTSNGSTWVSSAPNVGNALGSFVQTIGNGSSTSITVTHNLNTRNIVASVKDSTTYVEVFCDITASTVNTVTLGFGVAPSTNQYIVTILADGIPFLSANASFSDNTFSLKNDVDATKLINFQLSQISSGTTRTLTVPDANTTLVGTDATQTITNKDLGSATNTFPSSLATLTGSQSLSNKTLTNPTVTNYTESVNVIGTVSSTSTLSLTTGTVLTATLTANTQCTFTMPTAGAGKSFVLMLKQPASTGNGSATFTGVKWGIAGAPSITPAAGKMDILSFFSDGTNWYGSVAAGYTP